MNSFFLKVKDGIDIFINIIKPYSQYIVWALRFIIAFLLLYVIIKVVKRSIDINFFKKNISALYKNIEESAKNRSAKISKNKRIYGEHEESTILEKIDLNLKYSGLQKHYQWLTAEMFVVLLTITCLAVLIITCIFTNTWIARIIAPCLVIMSANAYMTMQRKRNYSSTSKQISTFANLVANYSGSTDDIVLILQKSAAMLKDPLRSMINETCAYARKTGNTIAAMKIFEESIEFYPLKSLIQNLSIAARNEANYKEIIEANREMIRDRIEAEAALANIYRTGRLEMTAITVFGIISTLILSTFILGKPLNVMLQNMLSSWTGQCVLGFSVLTILISIYFAFVHVEKGGR